MSRFFFFVIVVVFSFRVCECETVSVCAQHKNTLCFILILGDQVFIAIVSHFFCYGLVSFACGSGRTLKTLFSFRCLFFISSLLRSLFYYIQIYCRALSSCCSLSTLCEFTLLCAFAGQHSDHRCSAAQNFVRQNFNFRSRIIDSIRLHSKMNVNFSQFEAKVILK